MTYPNKCQVVELINVSHTFPNSNKPTLKKVSFHIESGQIFTLLGKNGAGKTTLVRIISTLILPTSGIVKVCEYDHIRASHQIRRRIGLCSDSQRSFYYRLTGKQNLEFFGGLTNIPRKTLPGRVNEVLELVGLFDARNTLFMRYSHGMRKKLSLARCILSEPQLYLLDEPTSGIDPHSAIMIRNLIQSLRAKGKAVLLTTHSLEEAINLSDTISILQEGEIIPIHATQTQERSLEDMFLSIVTP